jgi:hypothetical protein
VLHAEHVADAAVGGILGEQRLDGIQSGHELIIARRGRGR